MVIIESKKSLIKSILFLIFGALIVANPDSIIKIASTIIGIIIILYGVFLAFKNYYDTKQDSNTSSTTLIFGITCIIIGILFIVLADSIVKIIQYILGAWIIFNGIERLMIALSLGKDNSNFITQLVLSILLLAAGLYTIFRANLPIQIAGLVMIIYAILEIIGYITNKKDKISVKEEVEENIKLNNTNNNVKEAKIIETKDNKDTKETKKKKKSKK
ncbi:MAG: DUF308 domain-containing protein [Bacilli bacterium]|nr:DUF308 domain-containing protein [Bacilli bacterium]